MGPKAKLEHVSESIEINDILKALPGTIIIFDDKFKVLELFNDFNNHALNLSLESSLVNDINDEFKEKTISSLNKIQSKRGAKYFQADHSQVTKEEIFTFHYEISSHERPLVYFCTLNCLQDNVWLVHILDKSEQFYQDEIIQRQNDQIRDIAQMSSVGEMAAGVAHEVNNPLHIIVGLASKIKKKVLHGSDDLTDIIDYAGRIESTVQRISKIVTGLSQLARKDSVVDKELFNVSAMVEDVLSISGEKFQSIGLNVELDIDSKIDFYGKKVQLSQVILNFINNSFDAVSEMDAPWIKISAKCEDNLLKVAVIDSGTGVPDHVATKMFDPFFTTKPIGKGTGLGTSISKQIIEDHQGKIGHELRGGHTCFFFELPMLDQE
jgi:C4-dicarboxylate-specific signal transduction histidine kinase